jgi:hypothetical protein
VELGHVYGKLSFQRKLLTARHVVRRWRRCLDRGDDCQLRILPTRPRNAKLTVLVRETRMSTRQSDSRAPSIRSSISLTHTSLGEEKEGA